MRFALAQLLLVLALGACTLTNHPPTFVPFGDLTVRVGETLSFDVAADDPDGDALHFAMRFLDPLPPETATLTPTGKGTARFRWSPLISEALGTGRKYTVRFVVEDGYGGSDQADIVVTVFRQGGVPEFLNPAGYILDLSAREYVSFVVEVKDDDSADVTLAMEHPIDGALLDRQGPKKAEFYWRPSPEQIAAQLFHTVVFSADDGEHPAMLHEVGIVLLNAGAGSACPGTPPRLLHTPPSDVFGGGDLVLEAILSDAESVVRFPTVAYTLGSGGAEGSTPFELGADGRYRATLPTSTLPSNAAVLVSYHLTAEDNDDLTADRCDHASRAPKDGSYVVAWMGPLADGRCVDDAAEPDDDASGATALEPGLPVVRRLCPGNADRFAIEITDASRLTVRGTLLGPQAALTLTLLDAADAPLTASVSQPGGARLDVPTGLASGTYQVEVATPGDEGLAYALEAADAGSACPGDALEPNDDPATAPTLAEGTYVDLVLCPGELDAYLVPLSPGENVAVAIHFQQQQGDLDLAVLDPATQAILATSETTYDDERVFLVAPGLPQVLVAVLGYRDAGNAYSLEIATGGDDELCQEDLFAPNHTPIEAAVTLEGSWPGLVLCPGVEDWFQLGLNGGETLTLELTTASPVDRLNVFAQSPAAEAVPVACNPIDGGLGCQVAVTGPGTWRWGVAAASGLVAYDLGVWALEPDGPCLDDRLEPNDVGGKSVPLPVGVTSHLKICDGNEDWFHVDLSAYQPLAVYALFVPSLGAVQLELRDEAGVVIATSSAGEDAAVLEVEAPAAGRYRLLVEAPGVANTFYDLVVVLP